MKHYQQTKIVEVTNPQRSLSKNWRSCPPIAAELLKAKHVFFLTRTIATKTMFGNCNGGVAVKATCRHWWQVAPPPLVVVGKRQQ